MKNNIYTYSQGLPSNEQWWARGLTKLAPKFQIYFFFHPQYRLYTSKNSKKKYKYLD